MTYKQKWFVERRSTYTIDTPCLTKHYLITAKENSKKKTTRADSEPDEFRRRLIMLDSLRLADFIATRFCPDNEERFLDRREKWGRPEILKSIDADREAIFAQINCSKCNQEKPQNKKQKACENCADTNSKILNLFKGVSAANTRSRHQTLFLEKTYEVDDECKSGYLEVLIDVRFECVTVQFRLYPFSKSIEKDLAKFSEDTKVLKSVRQTLRAVSNEKQADLYENRLDDLDRGVLMKRQCDDIVEELFDTLWSQLKITHSDIESIIKDFESLACAEYDRLLEARPKCHKQYLLTEVYLNEYLYINEIDDGNKLPVPDLLRKYIDESDKFGGAINPYKSIAEISAVTEGIVLRRGLNRKNSEQEKAVAEPNVVKKMLELRDHRSEDMSYNSKVIPDELEPFYSPAQSQRISGEKSYQAVLKAQQVASEEWGKLIFADNVMQLQEHSIFFKTLLGFWPEDKESDEGTTPKITKKSIARDTHAATAVMSGFLDGLAVNGVSYHPIEGRENISSVRYFLLYGGPSRNQLARLVRRLHTCGDSRVLLADKFMEMKAASIKLTNLDRSVVRQIIDDDISLDFLSQKRRELGELKEDVSGGIQHRILQNQIYWDTLQNGIEDLREVRIKGWQTYSDFINRNYGPQINSISRTQERLDSVDDRLGNARHMIDTRTARNISSTIMLGVLVGSSLLTYQLLGSTFKIIQSEEICLQVVCLNEDRASTLKPVLLAAGYLLVLVVVSISIYRMFANNLFRDLTKRVSSFFQSE